MNRFNQRFQKAAQADPFAVDSLKIAEPKAGNIRATAGGLPAFHKDSHGQSASVAGQVRESSNDQPSVSGPNASTTVGGGATTFEPPEWATEPRPGIFFLEVMKDGIGIDQLPLERKATVFGRQAPVCHFVLDHPSVSRQHAALVYHKNGSFYVIDMGSAHGTFVSNERLRKDSPVEIEPGQSVKFAASTRMYILRQYKPGAESAGPRVRESATPPVELPPPPDPADTEAVVAYHTLVNRHGYDSPLNAEKLPEKEPPDKGPMDAQSERLRGGTDADGGSNERPSKRQRMRSRVSFSDQFGGALAQVVGVSDGADVDRVGPVGVPEGQALTGKYASLVETVIEPLPKRAAVSPKQSPAVSGKLKQYLSMSKGLYGDLPAPNTSESGGNNRGGQQAADKVAPISISTEATWPSPKARPMFGVDDDIFEDSKQVARSLEGVYSGQKSRPDVS